MSEISALAHCPKKKVTRYGLKPTCHNVGNSSARQAAVADCESSKVLKSSFDASLLNALPILGAQN